MSGHHLVVSTRLALVFLLLSMVLPLVLADCAETFAEASHRCFELDNPNGNCGIDYDPMVCAAKATCTFFNFNCTYAEIRQEEDEVRNALKSDPDCEPFLHTEHYKYLFEYVCTKSDTTRVVILVVVGIFLVAFIFLTITIAYWVFCSGGRGNSDRKSPPPTTNAGIKGKSKFSGVKSAV